MPNPATDRVRRYYDDNTRRFLRFGQGTEGTIHRAVWGPGVRTRDEAMTYVDAQVTEEVRRFASARPVRVLDLGCGVGSSLCRMAAEVEIEGTGITISEEQVELARARIEQLGLRERVRCVPGDFCEVPPAVGQVDLAFAIESFIHASDLAGFFRECARLIVPGGLLIVCDDFLSSRTVSDDPRAAHWLTRYRNGWMANNLVSLGEASRCAEQAGFTFDRSVDLTSSLELGRPRDLAIGALVRCFGWLPAMSNYVAMLYGGHALQIALQRGWLRYELAYWRRNETPA